MDEVKEEQSAPKKSKKQEDKDFLEYCLEMYELCNKKISHVGQFEWSDKEINSLHKLSLNYLKKMIGHIRKKSIGNSDYDFCYLCTQVASLYELFEDHIKVVKYLNMAINSFDIIYDDSNKERWPGELKEKFSLAKIEEMKHAHFLKIKDDLEVQNG